MIIYVINTIECKREKKCEKRESNKFWCANWRRTVLVKGTAKIRLFAIFSEGFKLGSEEMNYFSNNFSQTHNLRNPLLYSIFASRSLIQM